MTIAWASSAFWLTCGAVLMVTGLRLGYVAGLRYARRGLAAASRRAGGLPAVLAATGATFAAMARSSAVVSVSAQALVESRWIGMGQGLALLLGANLGTTLTAQVASLDGQGSTTITLIAAAAGLAGLRWAWLRDPSALLLALAAVVEGVDLLSRAALHLAEPVLAGWARAAAGGPPGVVPFLAGWAMTALVQSSTAVTTTTVRLAAHGLVDPAAAVLAVLGSNVGTVMTGLVTSLFLGHRARRLALVDLLTNLLPAVVFATALSPYVALLRWIDSRPERMVANGHTLFNLCTTLIFLPWVRRLGEWVDRD